MKLILILAFFMCAQAYASEDTRDHPDGESERVQEHKSKEHDSGKHGDDHEHGGMKHGDDSHDGDHGHGHKGMKHDGDDHGGGHGHGHGGDKHGDHGDDHGHGGGHGHGHGGKLDETRLKQFFEPLPESIIDEQKNAALIKLGKKLYMDPRLSVNDKISCNSCHSLSNFGVDNEPTSPGHEGKRGDRNSPTTMNAALHIAQFWDGRAADVEEQALGPILNPVEMGMPSEEAVVNKLKGIAEYKALFAEAFGNEKDPLKYKNIGVAIGAFERTLLTPSRFDDFLRGDKNALSKNEKRGLKKFINMGCVNCHNGAVIGGNSYKKIGLVVPYETSDMGRYGVTGLENDKKVFKVPSLRNITQTAPYFHDGSVETLDEAIELMAKHQLGRDHVGHGMIRDIKAFLGSLTAKSAE
ncbi:cytochrome-c peroxidase [Nitrosomonas marina]|uniref:Cytochrome c peroxidase n=1 Tax=Nitrosomonas marina TaxID=917 RepID=A0A1H8F7G3_9PROT|nr:cytochrome-c peroxidase [Nitrosomonas marina]SEN27436.1 cytochrome c peroxidase [Nitrosomonas marina]